MARIKYTGCFNIAWTEGNKKNSITIYRVVQYKKISHSLLLGFEIKSSFTRFTTTTYKHVLFILFIVTSLFLNIQRIWPTISKMSINDILAYSHDRKLMSLNSNNAIFAKKLFRLLKSILLCSSITSIL